MRPGRVRWGGACLPELVTWGRELGHISPQVRRCHEMKAEGLLVQTYLVPGSIRAPSLVLNTCTVPAGQ